MKQVGLLFNVFVLLLLYGISRATTVPTREYTSEMMPSRVKRLTNSEDMISVRYENHITRYDSASLDSLIRDHIVTAHIPGLATWAFKNGQIIWQQCYGYANLEDSIELADTTLFSLASISKTITGTAIMQLWERGLFELDDDIDSFLPFDVNCPAYPDSPITFRMLMTHTSSISYNSAILDPLMVPWRDSPIPLGTFLQGYLVPGGSYYSTLNFNGSVPGTQYEYCEVAIALLGYLVETIEDSFPIHCQDSIFHPLSMYETSWFLANSDTNNLARGYHWTGTSYIRQPWWGAPFYPSFQLKSSSVELGRYLAAILQHGIIDTVRILDSTTVELILSHQFEVAPDHWVGLVWHHIGWFFGNRWVWFHNGRIDGFDVIIGFCPEENSAVISFANCDNYGCSWTIATALLDYAQQYAVEENGIRIVADMGIMPTIFRGPLQLPEGREYKVFDIAGRVVDPSKIRPGIYFIEVDGVVTQKVVKVK